MSYLVLARKWRPQKFGDLVGQEHVSQTLQNAIHSGRVAHAFLFTGARGVGKTSAARILAKALTCEHGPAAEPCNACPACDEITSGVAVDVIEIDGASNTGVDDVRELRENVKYLPSRLRAKIFIIDEVHMLSTSAFNALLKTLEEPPPHVKFIFATTEPHKVPITILSRCQRFDFRRIALPVVVARLRYIVDQEGVEISEAALAMVGRKGDGSMRDSLSTLDQVLAFCGTTVSDEDVVALLGVVDRRLLVLASQSVFNRDSRSLLEIVKQVDANGYNIRQFCQELVEHFRLITLCKAVGDIAEYADLSEAELKEIHTQAQTVDLVDLYRHVAILIKAESDMAHTGFPRLVLEMALLKMAMLVPVLPAQELLSRLDGLRSAISGSGMVSSPAPSWTRGSSPRQQPPRPPASETAASLPKTDANQAVSRPAPSVGAKGSSSWASDWPGFVAWVCREKPMIGSLLEDARPLTASDGALEVGFPPNSFHFSALNSPAMLSDLNGLAKVYFGESVSVRLKTVSGSAGDAPMSIAEKKTH
ncbi:DNA polymerase III subunit gamma/tau [Geobacter sp. OR-1]|uniref:DNA polymerase III subunit gamma/tau n=1 Tax=Geobacter sp. OR-1 TaxID=1266765 RepID=UPI0005442F70|nr:DNA polymerase III subunit gamma/tau [Geobacter sp. OR-1]